MGYGAVRPQRVAKVPNEETAEPLGVLDVERLIEAERFENLVTICYLTEVRDHQVYDVPRDEA